MHRLRLVEIDEAIRWPSVEARVHAERIVPHHVTVDVAVRVLPMQSGLVDERMGVFVVFVVGGDEAVCDEIGHELHRREEIQTDEF